MIAFAWNCQYYSINFSIFNIFLFDGWLAGHIYWSSSSQPKPIHPMLVPSFKAALTLWFPLLCVKESTSSSPFFLFQTFEGECIPRLDELVKQIKSEDDNVFPHAWKGGIGCFTLGLAIMILTIMRVLLTPCCNSCMCCSSVYWVTFEFICSSAICMIGKTFNEYHAQN